MKISNIDYIKELKKFKSIIPELNLDSKTTSLDIAKSIYNFLTMRGMEYSYFRKLFNGYNELEYIQLKTAIINQGVDKSISFLDSVIKPNFDIKFNTFLKYNNYFALDGLSLKGDKYITSKTNDNLIETDEENVELYSGLPLDMVSNGDFNIQRNDSNDGTFTQKCKNYSSQISRSVNNVVQIGEDYVIQKMNNGTQNCGNYCKQINNGNSNMVCKDNSTIFTLNSSIISSNNNNEIEFGNDCEIDTKNENTLDGGNSNKISISDKNIVRVNNGNELNINNYNTIEAYSNNIIFINGLGNVIHLENRNNIYLDINFYKQKGDKNTLKIKKDNKVILMNGNLEIGELISKQNLGYETFELDYDLVQQYIEKYQA